jgi:predicted ATPase
MARLDRNPQTREIAQVGAVIGREFSYEMIVAVSQWPDTNLRDALDRLVESEILLRSGVSPLTTFRFRHALVQDAAYESLLLSTRRTLHGRVAELIEARFPDAVATEPALLAHHFTRAGLSEKAIAYCLSAARLAIARSAMAEAIAALRAGLQLLPDLPAEADARRAELELQVMLGSALRATRAPSAPETGQAWERARALCRDARDTPYLLQVLYGQFLFHQGNGNLAQARQLGEELLALVSTQNDPRALVRGHSAIGRTAFGQGDLAAACMHLEQALAVDDAALREGASSIQGPESRVLDLCYLSWALFIQGRCTRALERCRESIDLAEDLAEPYDLVVAYGNACYLHQFRRDRGAVARCAETVIALASEQGFPAWLSLGQIFRGWARAEGDERGAGLSLVEQALADHTATGERLEVPYLMSLRVECLAERGRLPDGLAALDQAMALAESTGEAWFDAELHRLQGEILLREPRGDTAATESFQRALDIAHAQGARTWELRAGLSLARLLIARRKRTAGHALLAPILRTFEAEAGLADLDEARRLLTADR